MARQIESEPDGLAERDRLLTVDGQTGQRDDLRNQTSSSLPLQRHAFDAVLLVRELCDTPVTRALEDSPRAFLHESSIAGQVLEIDRDRFVAVHLRSKRTLD